MKNYQLGDAPIQDDYRAQMKAMMEALDHTMNGDAKGADRKVGIVVMMFPFGAAGDGRCNFISNGADRRDMVLLMKEMIARFEGQPAITGRA